MFLLLHVPMCTRERRVLRTPSLTKREFPKLGFRVCYCDNGADLRVSPAATRLTVYRRPQVPRIARFRMVATRRGISALGTRLGRLPGKKCMANRRLHRDCSQRGVAIHALGEELGRDKAT